MRRRSSDVSAPPRCPEWNGPGGEAGSGPCKGDPRGEAGMEALDQRAAPEAAPRFKCPGDFSAVPFAPGPPFSPEMLQDPTKQLLLIRAPANFSPESLNGHVVPLSGLQTLKVLQPDRTYKLYGIQTTPGESGSCARLLAPLDHQGQICCAPPFAGSLSVWERFGDPSANQILLPVANRLAPQIPEGLKQRFLPFGGQLKRPFPPSSSRDAETPPRKKKKKKKRQLHTMEYLGDPEEQQSLVGRDLEVSFGESSAPLEEGGTSHQQEEEQQEKGTVAEGGEVLGLSGAMKELAEQETQPSSSWVASSQDSFLSGEAEELSHRIKKKKKKKHKEEVGENKDPLPDPNSINRQSEDEPQRQGQLEPQAEGNGDPGVEGLVHHKHKKKKKHREEAAPAQMDLSSPKEEAGRDPWEGSGLGNVVDGSLDLTKEGPGGELQGHKSKKKKKKKEKVEEEEQQPPLGQEAGQVLLEHIAVKQEQKGWDELDAASGEGVGRTDSLELSLEVPIQKHKKKKKKKKEQESEAP